jgi:hypothetical protein
MLSIDMLTSKILTAAAIAGSRSVLEAIEVYSIHDPISMELITNK